MFCFRIGRKRSSKRRLQWVRKKNGDIFVTRVKRPRSGPRQTPRPPQNVSAQPLEPIVSSPSSAPHERSRSRTRSRTRSRPQSRPRTRPQMSTHLPVAPRPRGRQNVGAPRQRSPSIIPLAQVPRRRSPPPDPHVVSGQVQEEVIERQQQRARVPARQATPDWTLDEETWLTEFMREGLPIEVAAEELGRTIGDVIVRWAQIEAENSETERRDRERQRARGISQIHHRPTNPPVTNQATPAAHAGVLDRTQEVMTQRIADMEVENRESERRGSERQRARDTSRSRHRPANPSLANQAPPAAHAELLDRTLERMTQRIADMELDNRDAERRGRERERARNTSRSRHRPANPPLANQASPAAPATNLHRTAENVTQPLADTEVENREAERRGRERQRARYKSRSRHRPANPPLANQASPAAQANNLYGIAENVTKRLADAEVENGEAERGGGERQQTGEELHAALSERTIRNVRQRLAEIENEDWEAERRARERQRVRGELWADIEVQNREAERRSVGLQRAREYFLAIIEDENRDAEWRARERQSAREELQNRCRPRNPAMTSRAAQTAPEVIPVRIVENVAQGSAIVEDVAPGSANIEDERKEEINRTVRMRQRASHEFQNLDGPTNQLRTNQAPLATPAAPQQRRRSPRPSSRRPVEHDAIAVDTAPEPVPAIARPDPEGERPSGASYRYREWNGRRRGFTTGNTSIRLRSANRYRSHSPRNPR